MILNHGIKNDDKLTSSHLKNIFDINTFSHMVLTEIFLELQDENEVFKEVWVNTSEAEFFPVMSPSYELTKKALGDFCVQHMLSSNCIFRKLVLGPFRNATYPKRPFSAQLYAWWIIFFAKRDFRMIVVSLNPLTHIFVLFQRVYVLFCKLLSFLVFLWKKGVGFFKTLFS